MQNKNRLNEALKKLDTLPAMPAIAQKLLSLPLDTSAGEDAMLRLIEHDPQLSAKIIGLANTPLLGASHRIASVKDAALLLGMNRVKSVAIGIAAMSALTKLPQGRLSVQNLWMHSLTVALAMKILAQSMPASRRPADDTLFLAGLLHDIGYLALAYLDTRLSDSLHAALETAAAGDILSIEQDLLGAAHSELGAQLALNWQLPNEIALALRWHHHPNAPDAGDGTVLAHIVHLAEKLLPACGIVEPASPDLTLDEWSVLSIDAKQEESLRQAIALQAEQAQQLVEVMR